MIDWVIDSHGGEFTEEDRNLLKWYMKGFKDELNGTSTIESDEPLENKAYMLGAHHALIGDDLRSTDYLTNEEILGMLR